MLTSTLPFGSDVYINASFFDPRFKFNWVSESVDLQADDVQIVLSKLHTVVRLFVEITNAFYIGEESTSDSTTTTASSSEPPPSPPISRICLTPTPPILLSQAPLFIAVYQVSSAQLPQPISGS